MKTEEQNLYRDIFWRIKSLQNFILYLLIEVVIYIVREFENFLQGKLKEKLNFYKYIGKHRISGRPDRQGGYWKMPDIRLNMQLGLFEQRISTYLFWESCSADVYHGEQNMTYSRGSKNVFDSKVMMVC